MIVETNAFNYAIASILFLCCSDNKIRLVTYFSWTLSTPELNYDTHDKEWLTIHESFQSWQHYLEGSGSLVDVGTDHKNLEYFASTKLLTWRQAHWSEFLSQFNMVVRFCPGKLSMKLDALTRCWDVYPKEGEKDYAHINPDNFQPVFTQEQLTASLHATYFAAPVLQASVLFDIKNLHNDILSSLPSDPLATVHLSTFKASDSHLSINSDSFICLDDCIYIPDSDDLCL